MLLSFMAELMCTRFVLVRTLIDILYSPAPNLDLMPSYWSYHNYNFQISHHPSLNYNWESQTFLKALIYSNCSLTIRICHTLAEVHCAI